MICSNCNINIKDNSETWRSCDLTFCSQYCCNNIVNKIEIMDPYLDYPDDWQNYKIESTKYNFMYFIYKKIQNEITYTYNRIYRITKFVFMKLF